MKTNLAEIKETGVDNLNSQRDRFKTLPLNLNLAKIILNLKTLLAPIKIIFNKVSRFIYMLIPILRHLTSKAYGCAPANHNTHLCCQHRLQQVKKQSFLIRPNP